MNNRNEYFFGVDPLKFKETNNNIADDIISLENNVKKLFGKKYNKDKKEITKEYISSTQLRSLYDKIKHCNNVEQIKLLYPKVLYVAARQSKDEGKKIVIEIANIIKVIVGMDDLRAFKMFMEALLSYQKFHYPSKN